jgi:hypothetical protein
MSDRVEEDMQLPFSQRYDVVPVPAVSSFDEVSQDLQTDLLNIVLSFTHTGGADWVSELALCIWGKFLHQSISDAPTDWADGEPFYPLSAVLDAAKIKQRLLPGWRVYELLDFVYRELGELSRNASYLGGSYGTPTFVRLRLCDEVNQALKRDFAGTKMIDGLITPITNKEECNAIEAAMQTPLAGVRAQLRKALALLSDHEDPKYSDSIKNSISAVETLCRKIIHKDRATLGQALGRLKDAGIQFHPALGKAFEEMYGYTNDDKSGIRHAMMDEDSLDLEDARYMLVACSAFINYLVVKADKAGIKFKLGE